MKRSVARILALGIVILTGPVVCNGSDSRYSEAATRVADELQQMPTWYDFSNDTEHGSVVAERITRVLKAISRESNDDIARGIMWYRDRQRAGGEEAVAPSRVFLLNRFLFDSGWPGIGGWQAPEGDALWPFAFHSNGGLILRQRPRGYAGTPYDGYADFVYLAKHFKRRAGLEPPPAK